MRCKACNVLLTASELKVLNPKTNDYDDLCGVCRSPHWDTGVVWDEGGEWVVDFVNEADTEAFVIMGESPDSDKAIFDTLYSSGSLSTDNY